MRKQITWLALTGLLAACGTSGYVQVVDVQSTLPVQQNNYVYDDGACRITYALWAEGGNAGFIVENLTEEILYLDLAKSFYVQNGTAHDYYLHRSFEHGTSSSTSNAFAQSALSLLVGTSGTYATTRTRGTSSNTTTWEKDVVAIPSHACKSIDEYSIADDVIQDCSVRLIPKKGHTREMTFSEANSPLRFSNFITYRIGELGEAKSVTHDFYVSRFANYSSKEVNEKVKTGCKGQKTETVCKEARNTRYYVRYSETHNKDYSADARSPMAMQGQQSDKDSAYQAKQKTSKKNKQK